MAYRKITLQLALISAPVDVNSGVEKDPVHHTVCVGTGGAPHNPTQVKQRTACPLTECDNDDASTFEKVAASTEGAVVLSKEEIAAAKTLAVGTTNKLVELSAHPASQVRSQTIPNGSVYFLAGTDGVTQGIDHIADAMKRHPRLAFLGVFSPSGRPNLYEFRLYGGSLVMVQLARTEDIKVLAQPVGELVPAYQQTMDAVLKGCVTPYDPLTYADATRARLAELAATKETATDVVLTKSSSKSAVLAPVVDLAAQMQASLDALTSKKVTPIRKPRAK